MNLNDVREAVKSGEISQLYLVERTGLSPSAVSQICSNTIKSPKHDNALAMIQALQDHRKKSRCRQNAEKKHSRSRDNQDSAAKEKVA